MLAKKKALLISLSILGLTCGTFLNAQNEKKVLTVENQSKIDSIKQSYIKMGIPAEMAERRAILVYEDKSKITTRSASRNVTPFPGSIWIDRDATGANYSDYHTYTPEEFIKKLFVKDADKLGSAIDDIIKNVKFTGVGWDEGAQAWTADDRSLHYFDHGDVASTVKSYDGVADVPRFGIENGFLLATGGGLSAEGKFEGNNMNGGVPTTNDGGTLIPDVDLQGTITELLMTQTILEFDFMPYVDSVSFQFIFASAEYRRFSNSPFNDAFGFFVTGPGLEDEWGNKGTTINIARYPNGDPISVNASNWGYRNGDDFQVYDHLGPIPVKTSGYGLSASGYDSVARNPDYHLPVYLSGLTSREGVSSYQECDTSLMEYRGHSILLTAKAKLKKGEWYHMKLAIGNATDNSLASGAYMMAGSFDLGAPEANYTSPYMTWNPSIDSMGLSHIYSGCEGEMQFLDLSFSGFGNLFLKTIDGAMDDYIVVDSIYLNDRKVNDCLNIATGNVVDFSEYEIGERYRIARNATDSVGKVYFSLKQLPLEFNGINNGIILSMNSTEDTVLFKLYSRIEHDIKYYPSPIISSNYLSLGLQGGSEKIHLSLNGGETWRLARDTISGKEITLTDWEITNLYDGYNRTYLLLKEPNSCWMDTIWIGSNNIPVTVRRLITIPEVDGVTTDPIPGKYYAEGHADFSFTAKYSGELLGVQAEGYYTKRRLIFGEDPQVKMELLADGSYRYTIRQVVEPWTISFSSVTNSDEVSNETLALQPVWSAGGILYVNTQGKNVVSIYTLTGTLYKQIEVNNSASIQLPQGFYVVSVAGNQYKVVIR